MARRVHTADDFGIKEWYMSIPPVTRILGSIWAATAVAAQLRLLSLDYLYLNSTLIFRRLQLWRLVTSIGFLGGFSPYFAMRLIWLVIYSPVLERMMTEFNPGEFAFFTLFSVLLLDLAAMFSPLATIYFIAGPFVYTIMYLWSREFSNQDVSIYGLVRIKAFYLPWAMLIVGMLFGSGTNALMSDVTGASHLNREMNTGVDAGIAVGHVFYFLKTIYPAQTGQYWLRCPLWLTRFMAKYYKTKQPTSQSGHQISFLREGLFTVDSGREDTGGGFRPFTGAGRRLHD